MESDWSTGFFVGVDPRASEALVLSGAPQKGRRVLSPYVDLVYKCEEMGDALGDDHTFHVDRSPWQFLIALENMLRSFCLAGTFVMRGPELKKNEEDRRVPMVETDPIEDHIFECRTFIF